jgi:hypothetical protein
MGRDIESRSVYGGRFFRKSNSNKDNLASILVRNWQRVSQRRIQESLGFWFQVQVRVSGWFRLSSLIRTI